MRCRSRPTKGQGPASTQARLPTGNVEYGQVVELSEPWSSAAVTSVGAVNRCPQDHTMAHQGDGIASAVEGRSNPLVKDGIEGFTVTATVVGLPDPCPGGVH